MVKKSILYYESRMAGAYSDIASHWIVIIAEAQIGGYGFAEYDAPIYTQVEQDEFTPKMATETLEFC